MTGFTYTHRVGHGGNLTASQVDGNFEAASVAVAAKPNVQAGTLVASTIEAATPTAAIDYVAAQISSVVVASAPSGLNNFDKVAAALGDDPAYHTTAAAATQAAADAATLAKSTADTAAALAATKATAYTTVNLGTGSTFSVTAASNAERSNYWSGSGSATATFSTIGAIAGQQIPIANIGSGTITMSGVGAATGYKTTIGPSEVGGAEFQGGSWLSITPSPGTASTALAAVTPATGGVGTVLTCTPVSGWNGTFQWYWSDTLANIGGATTSTYTIVGGDAGHNVACKFTPTFYGTNTVVISSSVPGQVTNFLFGTATTTTLPYTFTAPATGGAPTDYTIEYRTPPGSGAYTTFSDGVSTSTSGTITGLTSGTSYEGRATATNAAGAGTPSATNTKSTSSTKTTFTDNFAAGTLNGRWTPTQNGDGTTAGGWSVTAPADKLTYNGTGFGICYASCTAGNNTVAVDIDTGPYGYNYESIYIRYIDANNYVVAQYDTGLPGWRIYSVTGGIGDAGDVADANVRGGTGSNANTATVSVVGNLITVTLTGGLNPGSLSGTFTEHTTATKIALGCNTGRPDVQFDNVVLS